MLRRHHAALAALCVLLSACVQRSTKPTTPEGGAGQRMNATAAWNVYDPRNGEHLTLKTTAVDGGVSLLNVAVDQMPGGSSASTTLVDDAPFTPATSSVTPIGAQADESAPDSVNEGDVGAPRMSLNRNLYTAIRDAAGNERGLNIDANGRAGTVNLPANTSGTIMTSVTSASDQTSSAVDVRGYRIVCIYITEANTSTPVGAFSILGSADNSNFYTVHLDADKVIGTNFTGAYTSSTGYAGGYSVAVSSPSGTVVIEACLEATFPYYKLFWDNTSGGAVSTINAGYYAYN